MIPAYNEQEGIATYIKEIDYTFHKFEPLYIVVDDASTDQTILKLENIQEEVKLLILRNPRNLGHGNALLAGLRLAEKQDSSYVITVDGDGQFDPKDIRKLFDLRDEADILIGIRHYVTQKLFYRKVSTMMSRILFFLKYKRFPKDINSPLRILQKNFLHDFMSIATHEMKIPNILMTAFALKRSYSIGEVPVEVRRRFGFNQQGTSWGAKSFPSQTFMRFALSSTREILNSKF